MPFGKYKKLIRTPKQCNTCKTQETDTFYLYRCCDKLYCDKLCQRKDFSTHIKYCPKVKSN